MKQIVQDLKNGATQVIDVPCPATGPGELLIHSRRTLISAGTERMLVEFGRGNWIQKARQQPDKVRAVLAKARTDGVMPTLAAVFDKLDQPFPLGYCNAGVVMQTGSRVSGYAVGDRVVSNGKHAEAVAVPANLCAKIPDAVPDDDAAFTVVAAVALQGLRLAQPTLGEAFVVSGLGLIGLIAVQLLRAQGCRVLGLDFDARRLELAREFGAETLALGDADAALAAARAFSRGRGVDGVLITASTESSEPVHQAAQMCRKRGRIVLVGVTGLELSRADFYEKELSFQVSCSYGPGRYDPNYEQKGQDYPVGFVRWTEQRNFEAVLDMMAEGRLKLAPLVTQRFAVQDAGQAYAVIADSKGSLGVLLEYPEGDRPAARLERTIPNPLRTQPASAAHAAGARPVIAFIGSGNYATRVLMPHFKAAGARLKTVASAAGLGSAHAGRKFGFEELSTDTERIFADPEVDAVVITTRHDSHARFVLSALEAGKHVFVEKPLALTLPELSAIERAYEAALAARAQAAPPVLMVGFNRRYAPHVQQVRSLLESVGTQKSFIMTVNAGAIPAEHWTQDREIGGGRIIGEACHFIDLLRFLAGAPIERHAVSQMAARGGDTVTIQLEFADRSIGTIHYFANGTNQFPKERLEVFTGGRILQLDNFRRLRGYGWPRFRKASLWRQDKGQQACVEAFLAAIGAGKPPPIGFETLLEVSRVTVEIAESAR